MRARCFWLGRLSTLALAALPAAAAAQPVGSEFEVTASGATYPYGAHLVAADASGNFVVVWNGSGQEDGSGVFGRRYDSEAVPLGSEFRVNSFTTGGQGSPSVAAAADGDFVVVWESYAQDGSIHGIFGQRYDSAGNALGTEFRVNSYTAGYQGAPSAAAAADGGFVVVWWGGGQGDDEGIFGQRYNSEGVAQGDEFQVNSSTTGLQRFPSVASAANGNFVVVWLSYDEVNSDYEDPAIDFDVFGQRYDNEGVALGSEFRVSGGGGALQTVSVASDARRNFVVVWDSRGDDIYGQRYDSEGVALGDVFVVNSYVNDYQFRPSVASDASGNFVVAWDDAGHEASWQVLGRRFDSEGVAQGSDFQINAHRAFIQEHPSVGATGTNQFVVVWESLYEGVFGRRIGALPSLLISDVSVNEGNVPGKASRNWALFSVTLSAPSAQPVTLDYATANGTATAPSDYIAKSGTLTLSPGQTSTVIAVRVKEDNVQESDETFFVNLSNPMNASIADGQGLGKIVNDDP